jgi:hypothetical protein
MISSMLAGGVYHGFRVNTKHTSYFRIFKSNLHAMAIVAEPIELSYSRRRAEAGRVGCAKQENVVAK